MGRSSGGMTGSTSRIIQVGLALDFRKSRPPLSRLMAFCRRWPLAVRGLVPQPVHLLVEVDLASAARERPRRRSWPLNVRPNRSTKSRYCVFGQDLLDVCRALDVLARRVQLLRAHRRAGRPGCRACSAVASAIAWSSRPRPSPGGRARSSGRPRMLDSTRSIFLLHLPQGGLDHVLGDRLALDDDDVLLIVVRTDHQVPLGLCAQAGAGSCPGWPRPCSGQQLDGVLVLLLETGHPRPRSRRGACACRSLCCERISSALASMAPRRPQPPSSSLSTDRFCSISCRMSSWTSVTM